MSEIWCVRERENEKKESPQNKSSGIYRVSGIRHKRAPQSNPAKAPPTGEMTRVMHALMYGRVEVIRSVGFVV